MRAKVLWERKVQELSVTTEAALLISESCDRFSTCYKQKKTSVVKFKERGLLKIGAAACWRHTYLCQRDSIKSMGHTQRRHAHVVGLHCLACRPRALWADEEKSQKLSGFHEQSLVVHCAVTCLSCPTWGGGCRSLLFSTCSCWSAAVRCPSDSSEVLQQYGWRILNTDEQPAFCRWIKPAEVLKVLKISALWKPERCSCLLQKAVSECLLSAPPEYLYGLRSIRLRKDYWSVDYLCKCAYLALSAKPSRYVICLSNTSVPPSLSLSHAIACVCVCVCLHVWGRFLWQK